MDFSMLFIASNLEQLVKNGKQMKKSTFCFFDVNAHQSKKNSCPAIDVMKHLWTGKVPPFGITILPNLKKVGQRQLAYI